MEGRGVVNHVGERVPITQISELFVLLFSIIFGKCDCSPCPVSRVNLTVRRERTEYFAYHHVLILMLLFRNTQNCNICT